MHICYAVRSSSEAALHDVGVVADDPPVMSFPPNKKEAETHENPWVSASEKLFEFDGFRRLMASSPSAVKDDEAEIYGHRDQHECEPDSDETRVAGSCDSSCTEDAAGLWFRL